jgi:hypothetical protein
MKRTFKTHFFKILVCTAAIASAIVPSVSAQTEDPLAGEVVNAIAQKTITKFENSSCQDLATSMAKGKQDPNTLKDQITARFIQKLRQDPQLTQQFFNQISTPVLTKLFECGLVPPQK